jgi:predicted GH43/DUF377 family glycosyl hydrolase
MSALPTRTFLTKSPVRLRPDVARVIALPFVPGEETPAGVSRAVVVIDRILAMDAAEVSTELDGLRRDFGDRHHHLDATWTRHFRAAVRASGRDLDVSADRALLIGAYFTRECSLEAAALFNPSIVVHPDQEGVGPDGTRFVMSLRAVGEGHISSVEFRTGVIDGAGNVLVDDPGKNLDSGTHAPGPYERRLFRAKLVDGARGLGAAEFVLDRLPPQFGPAELAAAIDAMHHEVPVGAARTEAIDHVRRVASNNYSVVFASDTSVADRVLMPNGPAESHGMEDARFVRFVDDDGSVTYRATYTAFDSTNVASHQLSTIDFRTFVVSQLAGQFATNKGMALFPRKVLGRYVALSRWDRERSAVAFSDDGITWDEATTLTLALHPWELIQVGNCGSPLETADGWLVLTHGVGPMRQYAIGAMLLDLDDPRRVIGALRDPLLVADEDERDGYVPNVVYSCGAVVIGDRLVLPYGFADIGVGFAVVDLPELLCRLTGIR